MRGLTRWDPFRELSHLHRDVDELFKTSFGEMRGFGKWFRDIGEYPELECYTKDDKFYVKAALPGVDPKAVEINISGNHLTLRGERKEDKSVEKENYMLREMRHGSFERSLMIPEGVDGEKVHAFFEDGILTITAPVKEGVQARKIPIEVSKKEIKAA
jgi:HSP20 family protein